MSITTPAPAADIDTLRQGLEGRDVALIASLYADNAELRVVDRAHTPSSALELHGKEAIAAYYKDICDRDMTHHVDEAVADQDRLALTESCAYPDGTRVLCMAMMDLADGKIVRQTNMQTWDE